MMADGSAVDTSCADARREGDPIRSETGGNVDTSNESWRDEKLVFDINGERSRGENKGVFVDDRRISRETSWSPRVSSSTCALSRRLDNLMGNGEGLSGSRACSSNASTTDPRLLSDNWPDVSESPDERRDSGGSDGCGTEFRREANCCT
jgi:hypothetical protein